MKKIILMLGFALLCSLPNRAQTTGVQFGKTTDAEATVAKISPLLESEGLAAVEALCKQVATNGLEDALVRTKLFMLGQVVTQSGGATKHHAALEALYLRYAKESPSPIQQLFFIEQLRWIGTKRSASGIKELCESKDVNIAASANMARQAIIEQYDPQTVLFPKTKMLELKETLAKADEGEALKLLLAAVQTKGDLAYQAFAITQINKNLSTEALDKWCGVARTSDDPQVTVLLLRGLCLQKSGKVKDLLLEFCGHSDTGVARASLEMVAKNDPQNLQKALPKALAKVSDNNYKTYSAVLSAFPAQLVVPALSSVYGEQQVLAKQLILESLASYPTAGSLVKASMEVVTDPAAEAKLATAAFRYLRQHAGVDEQEKLLATLNAQKGNLQSEAVQAYSLAARLPGNECYSERLLQALKAEGDKPSEVLLDAAGRIGTPSLLPYVASLAATNKNAIRTLSTWRDGLAAVALMEVLAQKPTDAFILRSVRQQLQSTQLSVDELTKAYQALEATGKISADDLRDFKKLIDAATKQDSKPASKKEPKRAAKDSKKESKPAGTESKQDSTPVANTVVQAPKPKVDEEGFTVLFDGENLDAWVGNKTTYSVNENKEIFVDPSKGGTGDLYTAEEYGDFILRFEFKLTPGANNGIGVRTPKNVDAAYHGHEIQVLDDTAPKYANLLPGQYHGSVYKIVPAKRGSQKPVGEWNTEEIVMDGRHVKVTVNGVVIVDADLDEAAKVNKVSIDKHPGLNRTMGFISFCGHGDKLWYRNVKVKPIVRSPNTPPPGWTSLFNGKDLTNWKGVTKKEAFDNPLIRAAATPEKRADMQKIADEDAKLHWTIKDGVLCFDGKGFSLATAKDYANFEMWCDWRLLTKKGDSGIYLRGSPQVQIWDAHNQWKIGSGGLYNNKNNPSKALLIADNQIGEWNTFYIRMIGEKVDVYLNGKRVVDNVTLENYWDKKIPIFPKEQIELQCHGDPIEFKNIYIREL
jgi:Domain of Unknown Function (DUF1080)